MCTSIVRSTSTIISQNSDNKYTLKINDDYQPTDQRTNKTGAYRQRDTSSLTTSERETMDPIPHRSPSSSRSILHGNEDSFNVQLNHLRQNAIDNVFYRTTVDKWKPSTLNELLNILKTFISTKHPVDQAWIIFYWISQNIDYDEAAYSRGKIRHQSADSVFELKKCVCAGYATLFKVLCDSITLKCVKIKGYRKASFHTQSGTSACTSHSWNAIQIDHRWHLVEMTAGSGIITENYQYRRKLRSQYFLCPFSQMIYSRFPRDPKWQLLSHSITMEQFLNLPRVHQAFFDLKLEIIDPKNSNTIATKPIQKYAELKIRTPDDVRLSCSMSLNNKKIANNIQALYDSKEDLWRFTFAAEHAGQYMLTVYAKNREYAQKSAVEFIFYQS